MRKNKLFSLAALLVAMMLVLSACASQPAQETNKPEESAAKVDLSGFENSDIFITPQELSGMLDDPNVIIFDGNKPDAYAKGHIPGAISAGFHSFSKIEGKPGDPLWGTSLDKEELTKKLESFGVTNDKTVVFYSDVLTGPGPDGRNLWQMRMAGLDNVKLLYGGLAYWKELGYDITKDQSPAPAPSTGLVLKDFDDSYRATKEYVQENLDKTVIIDVRTEKEFKGSQNAGEARGGHIEGAKWLLWSDLLNENATPKSPEEIKEIMAAAGVTPEDDFVVY
ncbi:rhodanese domain protein [Peptoclostridium acidaminophilum DSM 3953]|uniref:thiosulfate sulfurtransferase n=1 Tax=Peptoclostridium acidaminophilum DSM 3953 TaxID=1286171 RepID=W8TL93_PEPAC|nr:rhodanese-like domain-containing protein [Peptoclostridium acidaminophilum]AHM56972.1 rhodanese domain protein [Peptoclostridium acidaminophilum DSM 3953]